MANIIDAIIQIVTHPKYELREYSDSHNRANNMGEALEEYIKDIFAGTTNETDENIRNLKISEVFSYTGNQNNPPDAMLINGDAIEVKKIETHTSLIALNSSYPKAKLFANSPMISNACRMCENWTVKDMIYAVGVVQKDSVRSLALVYGNDYCADKSVYERISKVIKAGVESISGVEFADTKELGRVNRVDPLGITYLRVRGMWGIVNPFETFKYIYTRDRTKQFNFMALINDEKFYSFDNYIELIRICDKLPNLDIKDVKIKNPNNPAQLRAAKLITFTV